MKNHRFPLPVSHDRAPVRCPLSTAVLALSVAFAAGVCVTSWFVALILQGGLS